MEKKLTLEMADKIASAALACRERNEFRPCNVLVVDAAGDTLVFRKADGSSPIATDICHAKAYTCIAMKISTREFRDKYLLDNDPKKFCQL